jgi:hypothetical protein
LRCNDGIRRYSFAFDQSFDASNVAALAEATSQVGQNPVFTPKERFIPNLFLQFVVLTKANTATRGRGRE